MEDSLESTDGPATFAGLGAVGVFPGLGRSMQVQARKATLRREVVARILAMDRANRLYEELALVERLESLPGFAEARTVLLYASAFPEEFETRPMLARALELGKRLACPRVDWDEKKLILFEVVEPPADLVPGPKGIPEPRPGLAEVDPTEVDWVLVPGLAFDRRGYRLGRGAGHYDRLLSTLRPEVPKWALVLSPQWVEEVPTEPHDLPVDGVAGANDQT